MTRPVVHAPRVLRDLRAIARYYRQAGPNDRVDAFLAGLVDAIDGLGELADRLPLSREGRELKLDIRQRLHGTGRNKYRILFMVEAGAVQVLHVRHALRSPVTAKDLGLAGPNEADGAR